MAFQATVIPVMIASPGDVIEERDVIRTVIHDWNDVNSITSKVMLAPMGWDSHSSPELGIRPQELINDRILRDCDILIGVFWTRLGTPTGKAQSGTVEEIERHVESGKPAMIYFSSKPIAPDSVDSDQYSNVKKFKEKCKKWGLVEEFENIEQFTRKVNKQIQLCITKNKYIQSIIKSDIILEKKSNVPDISEQKIGLTNEAKELLKAASSDDRGNILKIPTAGGTFISAGRHSFGGDSGREMAKWENALNELLKFELVIARGYKDEVFELTHKGWQVADKL